MKIRTGFVSNSSSSSFCIFGTYLNAEDLTEEQEDLLGELPYKNCKGDYPLTCIKLEYGITEDEARYVGISPDNIPDDKTLGEVKQVLAKTLTDLGFETSYSDIGFYEDGGYD